MASESLLMRTMSLIAFFVILFTSLGFAQPAHVEQKLRTTAAQKYDLGSDWTEGRSNLVWYTIVPHNDLFFASTSGSDENGMDFYAVWEYLSDGEWHYIFQHTATDAGPEAEIELDQIYAKHRFSSSMRKRLMHGTEKKF